MAERHGFECSHERGVFARIMAGLAAEHGEQKTVMIDATYLKAHRTATSMGVKVRRISQQSSGLLTRRTGVDA